MPPRSTAVLLLTGLSLVYLTQSATIVFTPFAYPSHVRQMMYIASGLKAKGHVVYFILTESYPQMAEVRKQYEVITFKARHRDVYSFSTDEFQEVFGKSSQFTVADNIRYNLPKLKFVELCTNALEDEELQHHVKEVIKPDLAIVDSLMFNRCFYIFFHNIDVPYVSFAPTYEPWLSKSPALPSFVPFQFQGAQSDRMTFVERFQNAYELVDWATSFGVDFMSDTDVQKYLKRPDPSMTYSKLHDKCLLWLLHSDWAIEYPRPQMPNEVYIGGLSTTPAKPLPGNIKTFVDNSDPHGVIVLAFGSKTQMPSAYTVKFFAAFAQLKQRVVMRDLGNSSNPPDNVLLSDWLPQNDLLGDPHTVLFLSHGGSNSLFEALYHGVPTIVFPLMGDQPYNALREVHAGCGLVLHPDAFTAAQLVAAITEILTNRSYKENAMKRSQIYRDRPDHPIDRAAWWIEHVIKYGGQHMHASALDMEWYEYLMLDMLLVFVLLPVTVVAMLFSCLITCCWFRCRDRTVKRESAYNGRVKKKKVPTATLR